MPPGIGYGPAALHPITGQPLDPERPYQNLMLLRQLNRQSPELAASLIAGPDRQNTAALAAALFGGAAPPISAMEPTAASTERPTADRPIAGLRAPTYEELNAMDDRAFDDEILGNNPNTAPTPRLLTRVRAKAQPPQPSGRVTGDLPKGVRLSLADRRVAQAPGNAEHQIELDRIRGRAGAMDAASLGGQRGVREAQYGELMERFPELGMPVGTTLVGGGDMDYVPRRKVPSGSLGAISARIAGLGTPFDMPETAPAIPDFVSRKSDPSELGRRTAQLRAMQDNSQYQATVQARQDREAQIAANMQAQREARASGEGEDPAWLRLLMRRNPALAVQARQQELDRQSREYEAADLADYRSEQASIARGELADRWRAGELDRANQRKIAEIGAGSRKKDLDSGTTQLLTLQAAKRLEDGFYGDPTSPEANDKMMADLARSKRMALGEDGGPPIITQTMPPQKPSDVETTVKEAGGASQALDALSDIADPQTAQRAIITKFGQAGVDALRKQLDREAAEIKFPANTPDDQIARRLVPINKRRRLIGLPEIKVSEVKRISLPDVRSTLPIPT